MCIFATPPTALILEYKRSVRFGTTYGPTQVKVVAGDAVSVLRLLNEKTLSLSYRNVDRGKLDKFGIGTTRSPIMPRVPFLKNDLSKVF